MMSCTAGSPDSPLTDPTLVDLPLDALVPVFNFLALRDRCDLDEAAQLQLPWDSSVRETMHPFKLAQAKCFLFMTHYLSTPLQASFVQHLPHASGPEQCLL